MSEYARGGIVPGGQTSLRMVPEPRPLVGGDSSLIYADECFVSSDSLCRRSDPWHRAARIAGERMWICLAHD